MKWTDESFRNWIKREYARCNEPVMMLVNNGATSRLIALQAWPLLWEWYQDDLAQQSEYMLPNDEITERFYEFHQANPWIYHIFETWALEDLRTGQSHGAIEQLVNNLRWGRPHPFSIHKTSDVAEIPNEFKSRYSRMLMKNNQELHGYFRIKRLKSWGV